MAVIELIECLGALPGCGASRRLHETEGVRWGLDQEHQRSAHLAAVFCGDGYDDPDDEILCV